MEKSHDLTKKQMIEILVVTFVLGMAILIFDFVNTNYKFDGRLERKEPGTGSFTEELKLNFLDQKQDISVDVSSRRLTDAELKETFEKAVEEIENTYLGKNASANEVTEDLDFKTSYVDGLIEADWKVDPTGVISKDGKLNPKAISEDGEVINITAFLYYEGEEYLHSFAVAVLPKSLDSVEGQLAAITKAVESEDENTIREETLTLPKEVEGMSLTWKRKMNPRGLYIILLGVAAVLAIKLGSKQDERKLKKQLIEAKERDYPLIVSQLSILMGAGMSFRKALERIVSKYQNALKQGGEAKAGFEEMVKLYRQINDGQGEVQALEQLGKTSESKEYRKLAMMITQNLRKGSRDLLEALEKEEQYAFEMRKQRAIRLGEEASTKLLLPMGGMLFIVIVVLIVPAVMQMNI